MSVAAGLTLVALVLVAGLTDRAKISGAAAVGLLGLLWLVVNQPMEGAVLLEVSRNHGLTVADLTGLAAIALATWRVRQIRRARARLRSRRPQVR